MMVTMKSRLVLVTLIFIWMFSTIARADVIADRPGEISGTANTQENALQIGGGTEQSAGAGSVQTGVGPVITDAPQLDPAGGNASSQTSGGGSAGAQIRQLTDGPVVSDPNTGTQTVPPTGTQTGGEQLPPTGTQTVIVLPEQKNAVIKAPENIQMISGPVQGSGTQTGVKAPEGEATGTTEKDQTVANETVENAPVKDNAPAGPGTTGPGSQRVSLGFGIVSPAHNMGSQNLAIGSVELADGSWQALGYEASIHAPYYKLIRETVDSLGTAWYVVKYSGNRIGNAHTNDGTKASEIWLLKSDCRAKNYIDIATANPTRAKIVAAALELLGSKYAYGGAGPESFDCSGLVKYVCSKAGVTVPRTSSEICAMSGKVDLSKLRPGDICARNGHVGIYIGNDVFIHASESSVGVVAEYLSSYNAINKFTVYINVVGD